MAEWRFIVAAVLAGLIGCGGGDTEGGGMNKPADSEKARHDAVGAEIDAVTTALKSGDLASAQAALAPLSQRKESLPVELALKIDALEREAAQLRATKDVKAPQLPELPPPKVE